jgi:FlaA1/EpsC-like NDP-sugar epimerase
MTVFHDLLQPTPGKRTVFFLLIDSLIICISLIAAIGLRFGLRFPEQYLEVFFQWLLLIYIIKIFLLLIFKTYQIIWVFASLVDVMNILKVSLISTFILYAINLFMFDFNRAAYLPKGVIILDAIISFSLIAIFRLSKRIYYMFTRGTDKIGKKTLIIGCDFVGEKIVKELLYEKDAKLYPLAFIDEDSSRHNTYVHGIVVYGGFDKIQEIITAFGIEVVLINLPKASHKLISNLYKPIRDAGVFDIRVVPKVDAYEREIFQLKDFKQIAIEDLLSREVILIETQKLQLFLQDKVVLITGAPGSIGFEIVLQLIKLKVKKIIAFEVDETELFKMKQQIDNLKSENQELVYVVGDVRDEKKLERVFKSHSPQIVFHTAAYKHVPLMEEHPEEAVKTNIFGTYNLVKLAAKYRCEKMVNISTDKAVLPSSIMGATKRMAEIVCNSYPTSTKMISVRFGNVLGSRGSVVPIFLDQIQRGGPVTITHSEMKRYFMSIPEAVSLVLQAGFMGSGGEVFVLNMGEPVKILTLAENLILLNNLVPHQDILIVCSGIRPGEKLFEELLTAEEGTDLTYHEKILVARNIERFEEKKLEEILMLFKEGLKIPGAVKKLLAETIPFYTGKA